MNEEVWRDNIGYGFFMKTSSAKESSLYGLLLERPHQLSYKLMVSSRREKKKPARNYNLLSFHRSDNCQLRPSSCGGSGQKGNYGKPPCLALVAQSRGWRPIIEANCRKNQIAGRIWIVARWWTVKNLETVLVYISTFIGLEASHRKVEQAAVSSWLDQKSEPWTCENGVDLVYPGAFRYCKCGRFLTMPFTRSVQSGLKNWSNTQHQRTSQCMAPNNLNGWAKMSNLHKLQGLRF